MTRTKAPAYQWYPSDYLGCEHVQQMTLEAEGAYRRLLDHQWLNGSIPNDINALARICRNIRPTRMRKLWAMISPCFVPTEDWDASTALAPSALVNRRLERVKRERLAFATERIESGRKGGLARAENERERSQGFTGDDVPPGGARTRVGASASSSAQAQLKPPSPSPPPPPSNSFKNGAQSAPTAGAVVFSKATAGRTGGKQSASSTPVRPIRKATMPDEPACGEPDVMPGWFEFLKATGQHFGRTLPAWFDTETQRKAYLRLRAHDLPHWQIMALVGLDLEQGGNREEMAS